MLHAHAEMTVPTAQDSLRAGELRHALRRLEGVDRPVRVQVEAESLELPPLVSRLLMDILGETAAGRAVSLAAVAPEITTQEAAGLLNVSRPFLVGMIDKGILPARLVGNQRRLPLADVLAYKADNRARRRASLDEMARMDQELGLI